MSDLEIYFHAESLTPKQRIVQSLAEKGFPVDECGLVSYAKDNKFSIPDLVLAILPTDAVAVKILRDVKFVPENTPIDTKLRDLYHESMAWLQWLMFEGEPCVLKKELSNLSIGQRGVCGSVWGKNDLAYRCRTCEHDPTCAICIPCFQNGNHEDHDYSIIHTGGGCCDCGDETAWKRDGFCSKHRGIEHIQHLPSNYANSVGPVLDALFVFWKFTLLSAEAISNDLGGSDFVELKRSRDELTFVVVEMLLEFWDCSESMLAFVSERISYLVGLLDILVRAERFLGKFVVKKLHELLLKLLSEPNFKFEFAKVFLVYYPSVVNEVVKASKDSVLQEYELLSTFSVQIFTVPSLTPHLIMDMNLLEILMGCLEDIFTSCAGEDGRLQVSKWENLYEITLRVVEDIRFALSHDLALKYVTDSHCDIIRTWLKLLSFVQGTNPHKRETAIHIEEDNENTFLPFVLGLSIATIHSLLVNGIFSVPEEMGRITHLNMYKEDLDDEARIQHAKVGRFSQEKFVYNLFNVKYGTLPDHLIPPAFTLMISECLKAIEDWLEVDLINVLSPNVNNICSNLLEIKKSLSKLRNRKSILGLSGSSEVHGRKCAPSNNDSHTSIDMDIGQRKGHSYKPIITEMVNGSDQSSHNGSVQLLGLSDWPDISFDVSLQEISVHIPLHRLLSSLIVKVLRKYSQKLNVNKASSADPLCLDFFKNVLKGCHPYGFSAFVMEHPLRNRVFCAQVHAGMWRTNGDSALSSFGWYRGGLDFELDLFLLQCCAAFAPPDLYVNRILERFGLSNYLSLSLERTSEYEPFLVQEMLTLLIQIVKERRFCGKTTAESLKREMVCRLAISDATHSQLVKYLPRDLSKNSELQDVLDTVALYSNPSGINQGMYSLRWEYWKELDLYHPRWNPRDLQDAEERYQHFCSISPLITQLPKWTKIYDPLKGVTKVATCKMSFQIIYSVIYYAVMTDNSNSSRAPDMVLLTALHFLSLTLDILSDVSYYIEDEIRTISFVCEEVSEANRSGGQSLLSLLVMLMGMRKNEDLEYEEARNCNIPYLIESLLKMFAKIDSGCMDKLQTLAPGAIHSTCSILDSDKYNGLSISDSEKRKAKARERQAAMMEKMKAQQSKFLESMKATLDDDLNLESDVEESKSDFRDDLEKSLEDVCSLCHNTKSGNFVSYLVFLQKSRLLSLIDRDPASWEQGDQSNKAHFPISADQIIDQTENDTTLNSSETVISSQFFQNVVNELAYSGNSEDINAVVAFIRIHYPTVRSIQKPCRSNDSNVSSRYSFETLEDDLYLSICREIHGDLNRVEDGGDFITTDQCSKSIEGESIFLGKYLSGITREIYKKISKHDEFGPSEADGVYLSSCGHCVHQDCLDRYLSSLKERYSRRVSFEGGNIVDPDKGEFLCPVCRRLANSVLPALPNGSCKTWIQPNDLSGNSKYLENSLTLLSNEPINYPHLQRALSLLRSSAYAIGKGDVYKTFHMQKNELLSRNLEPFCHRLSGMYLTGNQDHMSQSVRVNRSMIMWDTLIYSLISMEIAARSGKTSLIPCYDLEALYKRLKSSNGFILSLFLKIVQRLRIKNPVLVLQRFRGIQLFERSICHDDSAYEFSGTISKDNILHVLKHTEMESTYPGIQFWKRASDPILAHDPFSSLMWIFFCLPHPFLSSKDSFISLVHLFYYVSVTQAIITYCSKYHWKMGELGYHDCLIADICKFMEEVQVPHQHFVSKDMDSSCNIKDVTRTSCFPYLRRCILLWELVNCSTSPHFCDTNATSYGLFSGIDVSTGKACSNASKLIEVGKLEVMFGIPQFNVALKDKLLRSLALKWSHHFCKVVKSRRPDLVLYLTPSTPFKLMHLPRVYQDLVKRYIKQWCPDCDPAMCLLCGSLCSSGMRPCCRDNGCQTHAMTCGAGTGVFLLIRKTMFLLQRSARRSLWPTAFLDAFGEEDINMNRGRPLYMNEERYAALTQMVASHGLDQCSKVLSQTTTGSFLVV